MKYLFVACTLLFAFGCVKPKKAELVVHNAQIIDNTRQAHRHEAMAVSGGKIMELGDEHQIMNKYLADRYVDAKKKPVVPGLIDAQTLFPALSGSNNSLTPAKAASAEDWVHFQNRCFQNGITTARCIAQTKAQILLADSLSKGSTLKLNVVFQVLPGKQAFRPVHGLPTLAKNITFEGFAAMPGSSPMISVDSIAAICKAQHLKLHLLMADSAYQSQSVGTMAKNLNGANDLRWCISGKLPSDQRILDHIKANTIIPVVTPEFFESGTPPLGHDQLHNLIGMYLAGSWYPMYELNSNRLLHELYKYTGQKKTDLPLKTLTQFNAIGIGLESQVGMLKPGMQADFVILNHLPGTDVDSKQIGFIKTTFKNGKQVYPD